MLVDEDNSPVRRSGIPYTNSAGEWARSSLGMERMPNKMTDSVSTQLLLSFNRAQRAAFICL